MGWFWSDPQARPAARSAPHPSIRDSKLAPPVKSPASDIGFSAANNSQPECPMHVKSAEALKPKNLESSCPYTPTKISREENEPPASKSSSHSKLNPLNRLNYMFSDLSQDRADKQKVALGTEREASTIPKGEGQGTWEYPSPQQMYNALLRKGYHDTDPEHVTSMVSVHNFLNEGAWNEVRVWEGLFGRGLADGWKYCQRGEANIDPAVADMADPKLLRFQGRPKDMTPKAALVQFMAWIYPRGYEQKPPFDRHDWYVERKVGGQTKEIRYVIDYYEGPDEPSGEPVFYLDVRPAVDSPVLAAERIMRWGGDIWYRASGASERESPKST